MSTVLSGGNSSTTAVTASAAPGAPASRRRSVDGTNARARSTRKTAGASRRAPSRRSLIARTDPEQRAGREGRDQHRDADEDAAEHPPDGDVERPGGRGGQRG